ncbi:MAG: VanZ family protein [Thermoanaerobaculaceae bacterium]|jgi:VanZ family protein
MHAPRPLSVAHGVLLEVVQYFTPPRSAEVGDAVADAMGARFGVAVPAAWKRRG